MDVSSDLFISNFFAYEASLRDYLHLIVERHLDEPNYETVGPNSLFLEYLKSDEALIFLDFIKYWDWSSIAMIYTQTPTNLVKADRFRSEK